MGGEREERLDEGAKTEGRTRECGDGRAAARGRRAGGEQESGEQEREHERERRTRIQADSGSPVGVRLAPREGAMQTAYGDSCEREPPRRLRRSPMREHTQAS